MKRRSKARTRSVAKSLRGSGSGSRDRKNPAQLLKLRDEKKEVKGVQDSLCPHGLGKKEEEEIPECECCGGDAGGPHYSVSCPYLLQLPRTVKSVGRALLYCVCIVVPLITSAGMNESVLIYLCVFVVEWSVTTRTVNAGSRKKWN